jgi:ribosome recycling factor
MSGEQRQKMVALIKKRAEETKVSCRNVRRDANKNLEAAEKAGEMTEDDLDKGKDQVQNLLKTYEDKIQDLADKKAKEVMEQ